MSCSLNEMVPLAPYPPPRCSPVHALSLITKTPAEAGMA